MLLYHRLASASKRCRWNGQQCRLWSHCSFRNSLIWVYIVCTDLSVRKLWNILVPIIFIVFFFSVAVITWAPSSEFVSSSIPSWQIVTAHAQPFRGARDLAFCLKVPLDSLLIWASSGGSGETARMRRIAWTFAARISLSTKFAWCSSHFSHIHFVPVNSPQ